MKKILFFTPLLLLPLVTYAQTLDGMLANIVVVLGSVIVPFLFGIAFLFFVINVFRYFVLGGHNPESQEKAKSLAIYGVLAFVFLVIFWGIINMFSTTLGLEGESMATPDYIGQQSLKSPTCKSGETSVCSDIFGVTVCRCK